MTAGTLIAFHASSLLEIVAQGRPVPSPIHRRFGLPSGCTGLTQESLGGMLLRVAKWAVVAIATDTVLVEFARDRLGGHGVVLR